MSCHFICDRQLMLFQARPMSRFPVGSAGVCGLDGAELPRGGEPGQCSKEGGSLGRTSALSESSPCPACLVSS